MPRKSLRVRMRAGGVTSAPLLGDLRSWKHQTRCGCGERREAPPALTNWSATAECRFHCGAPIDRFRFRGVDDCEFMVSRRQDFTTALVSASGCGSVLRALCKKNGSFWRDAAADFERVCADTISAPARTDRESDSPHPQTGSATRRELAADVRPRFRPGT